MRQTAMEHVSVEKEVVPQPEQSILYDKHAELYEAYFHEMRGFYERIQELERSSR